MPLRRSPRLEVIGRHGAVETGSLRLADKLQQFGWRKLFVGSVVTEGYQIALLVYGDPEEQQRWTRDEGQCCAPALGSHRLARGFRVAHGDLRIAGAAP